MYCSALYYTWAKILNINEFKLIKCSKFADFNKVSFFKDFFSETDIAKNINFAGLYHDSYVFDIFSHWHIIQLYNFHVSVF